MQQYGVIWRKKLFEFEIWNVNIFPEIQTLNQEFQFEGWSSKSKCKNLSYICQIDNEGHTLSSNLQCRLAGDSVRSLFRTSSFYLFVETVEYDVRILKDNLVRILSRVCHKQSLPPEFSHGTRGSRQLREHVPWTQIKTKLIFWI